MPDEPEVVQPEQGQGDGGSGSAPYASYLEQIPADLRGQVEPVFQKWDGDVTRRFQESAWSKPYEQFRDQLGEPEQVQELLTLRDMLLGDPQRSQEWWKSYAEANGLQATPQPQEPQQPALDDPFLSEEDRMAKLLDERLSPLQQGLAEMQAFREQQEIQAREAGWNQLFEGQLADLKGKHPDDFAIKDANGGSLAEEYTARFAQAYVESDPHHAVERAFQDWQALRGQLEKTVLQEKTSTPAPAEGGGVPAGAPDDLPTSLKAVGNIALERLRQANQA